MPTDKEHTTTQSYLEEFTNNVDVVTYCGGSIGMAHRHLQTLAKERSIDLNTITDEERKEL